MRKFKTRWPRGLPFRLLLIVAGAALLMAAFAPRGNAALIVYFNFEGPDTPPYPVNMMSDNLGAVSTTLITNYTVANTLQGPGLPQNLVFGDPDPNLTSLGLARSGANSPANLDIVLNTPMGVFQDMTLSFAINAQGNGFTNANIQFSTDGGATFTTAFSQAIPSSGTIVVSGALPTAANNTPLLTVRIQLTGGQSNGTNLQNAIDNIQINGTIIPEPATVVGGLLGVLGLGWQQRRRLIHSLRWRRT